ncbi:MAG: dioxygenase extradiol [Chloroflexota bacterium]|nr:dioxygenase extradiol [Chloroflexota bacterium]
MVNYDYPELIQSLKAENQMPVLFVGHGNPMNAIEDNRFSATWREVGQLLPKPEAILCISAHWETWGPAVNVLEKPRTIHDFGGFPQELYEVQYPAPGSPDLAQRVLDKIRPTAVSADSDWGLDHGCWSVLRRMYPDADVPVVQLSLDYTQPAAFHYELGKQLACLRKEGVLILGSGNMVHNLRRIVMVSEDFNQAFGLDWALEASKQLKRLIVEERFDELVDYRSISEEMQLAVPTPEHYLPMLYSLAAKQAGDRMAFFNDEPLAGSLTMTSIVIGGA